MEWDLNALLYAVGAMGLFSSRAFVPAFLTALMMRYGGAMPFLGEIEFLQTTGHEPSWFTHNGTILVLGLLAFAEVVANKSPELEEMMASFYKSAKSIMGALTTMGVMNSSDAAFIAETLPLDQANVFETVLSGVVAVVVWVLTTIRNFLMEGVMFADPDGSLGLRKLVSWFEDIWASVGIIFLFLYPIGMMILIILVMATMGVMKKLRERREEKSKRPCVSCGEAIYPCAFYCPSCDSEQKDVKAIGFFGQSLEKPVEGVQAAKLKLAEKKRCPRCASRLKERDPQLKCLECAHPVFADDAFNDAYLAQVRSRLPKVLAICAGFSLVPVIGLIPGVIYYRIALVAPFMGYLSASRSLFLKVLLRIILLLLIGLQLVPGIGIVSVPLMALLSYGLYRGTFASQLNVQAVQ